MQFLLIARDASDPGTAEQRKALRDEHAVGLRRLKAAGNYILGGAILDAQNEMAGSMLLLDFPDRESLDAWLKDEAYMREKVWQSVVIEPFRAAPI